jgi:hypothetical protein
MHRRATLSRWWHFGAGLVWVRLARRAAVDGGGAEVALDSAREEMREGDERVLDGKPCWTRRSCGSARGWRMRERYRGGLMGGES